MATRKRIKRKPGADCFVWDFARTDENPLTLREDAFVSLDLGKDEVLLQSDPFIDDAERRACWEQNRDFIWKWASAVWGYCASPRWKGTVPRGARDYDGAKQGAAWQPGEFKRYAKRLISEARILDKHGRPGRRYLPGFDGEVGPVDDDDRMLRAYDQYEPPKPPLYNSRLAELAGGAGTAEQAKRAQGFLDQIKTLQE